MQRTRTRQRRARNLVRSAWIAAGVSVVAVVILIAIGARPLPKVSVPTPIPRPYAGEGLTLGPADAPVVMEEYSDFQ